MSRTINIAFIAACSSIALSGCSSIPVADNAAKLEVSFSWTAKSGCSPVSPPITVANVPGNAKYLKVTMVDLDKPSYNHGGGEISYRGVQDIPEGTLKSYDGPCPPMGSHSYEITVHALDADKKLIIGQGKSIRKYPN